MKKKKRQKNTENIKYIKKVLKQIFSNKKLMIGWIITLILSVTINAITPLIDANILTSITNFIPNKIITFLLIALGIRLSNSIINYYITLMTEKVEQDLILNLKHDFTKEVYDLETKNFDREGTGVFAERINSEPPAIAYSIYGFRYRILQIVSSLGVYVYLLIISWQIAISVALSSVILVIVEKKRISIYKKHSEEKNVLNEDRFSDFNEFIRGVRDIKVLNIKDFVLKKIYRDQKYIADKDINHLKKTKLFVNFSYIYNDLSKFLIILLGIYLVYQNELVSTNLIIIYVYLNKALYLSSDMTHLYEELVNINISVTRLTEINDEEKYPKEKFGNKNIKVLEGQIKLKNLNFEYTEGNKVLKNINLEIDKNTTVGFVGESGQGKTTIFNLISKLYQVDDKSLFIDGYDINELSENSIRNNISVITQNPYIFNTTIRENLKMVNSKITDEELNKVLKSCQLDKFIKELENGLDSKVGEGGVTLSGGQRQRLALARTMVKKSNIILLDEATSALDNKTQNEIQEAIKEVGKEKTMLIVAHRLSTVINCDKIFVIDNGKVISQGTHKELMKSCKKYKELYQVEKD